VTPAPVAPPWPRVWAHRGGGRLAPENTLAGIAQAVTVGCRGIEFDVMLSADGTPVLIHDETVDRTTDGRGRVAQLSDAELARLDAGGWYGAQWAGEPIPRLDQALVAGLAADLFMNVEIKPARGFEADTGRVAAELVAEVMAGREGRVVLSSFSEEALDAARAAASQLPRGLLVGRIPAGWLGRCQALGCMALHADIRHLDAGHVARIKAAGLRLATYTENQLFKARQAVDWGIDAIITDHPDRISEATLGIHPDRGASPA
jgi:glycerophosphoryl diester phosphodiesterase